MLSTKDIADLEKKYSRYILKKRFKSFLIALFFTLFASSATYYIFYFYKSKIQIKKMQPIEKIAEKNISTLFLKKDQNTSLKKNSILASKQPIKTAEKNTTVKVQKSEYISSDDLNKTVIPKKKNNTQENFVFRIRPSNTFVIDHSNRRSLIFFYPFHDITVAKTNKKNDKIAKNTKKNATITDGEKKKPKINIEMKDIDSIKYLNNKFKRTHDIVFALMLCENYYQQKDYRNSLKWSIIANDIDSSSERSWIWFAKSKYRLHQKNDAVKALRSFLKTNSSENIKSLLRDIINGVLND
ncbi:MAG: hypothetical protein QM482_06585 [Sulfurospirillum sp.]